jgi:hypothetical protein
MLWSSGVRTTEAYLRAIWRREDEPSGLVDQIQQASEFLEKLLALLQSAPVEPDPICFPPIYYKIVRHKSLYLNEEIPPTRCACGHQPSSWRSHQILSRTPA